MPAQWAKNEVTAAKRRCDLIVYADTGTLAYRGTDFMTLGIVYIAAGAVDFALATGTCTNKRRPLTFTPFTFEGNDLAGESGPPADTLVAVAHGLETGDGPFTLSNSGGALPAGLSAATDYYAVQVIGGDDWFRVAESLEDAYAGTYVTLSGDGTGTHTLTASVTCTRGLDGYFTYEATQAETDVDGSEIGVLIEGTDYSRANGGGTYTSVGLTSGSDDYGSAILEGSITRDDATRGMLAILAGRSSGYDTGTIKFRDQANTKDRWTFTVNSTGRLTAVADDLA